MKAVGLAGAHRVGKTTLAQVYSQRWTVPFVETSLSKIYEKSGLSVNDDIPYAQRLEIQHKLLSHIKEVYKSQSGTQFITDRTPIDLAAYLLSYMPHNVDESLSKATTDYIDDCFKATDCHFDQIVVIQPGIALDETGLSSKGACIEAWIEKLNYLIRGLVQTHKLALATSYIFGRHMTDLDERVAAVGRCVGLEERQLIHSASDFIH